MRKFSLAEVNMPDKARQKLARWQCQVCGYVYTGEGPPETCPVCGAPKAEFKRLE